MVRTFRICPRRPWPGCPSICGRCTTSPRPAQDTVSSEGLAAAAGVNSAKLRKDLSHLGSYGTRGVGYDVALLIEQIEQVLGLHQRRAVALVGVGNLGHALAGYGGFATRGFRIAALFDADPAPGRRADRRPRCVHIDDAGRVVREERSRSP